MEDVDAQFVMLLTSSGPNAATLLHNTNHNSDMTGSGNQGCTSTNNTNNNNTASFLSTFQDPALITARLHQMSSSSTTDEDGGSSGGNANNGGTDGAANNGGGGRKNFLIDTSTPHNDAVISESSVLKPGLGWITTHVTESLRRGVHEWAVKVEHQGETADGSGLMLGIVPKNFSKFDSFISQGGGWCLSRAGKLYGHWRRVDNNISVTSLTFATGDRVVFLLDFDTSRMTVRVGDRSITGEISGLLPGMDVYPAVSLHYRHQHLRFEYHKQHKRNVATKNWVQRGAFPSAVLYVPVTSTQQLRKMPLDHYLLHEDMMTVATTTSSSSSSGPDNSSSTATEIGQQRSESSDHNNGSSSHYNIYSQEAAAHARLSVVIRAFAAVHRFRAWGASTFDQFLPCDVTAAFLREQSSKFSQRQSSSMLQQRHPASPFGLNAAALMLSHLANHIVRSSSSSSSAMQSMMTFVAAAPTLTQHLMQQPLFSLAETSGSTELSPQVSATIAQRLRDVVKFIRTSSSVSTGGGFDVNAMLSSLVELQVVLAIQTGSISNSLWACLACLSSSSSSSRTPDNNDSSSSLSLLTLTPQFVTWIAAVERATAPRYTLDLEAETAHNSSTSATTPIAPNHSTMTASLASVQARRGRITRSVALGTALLGSSNSSSSSSTSPLPGRTPSTATTTVPHATPPAASLVHSMTCSENGSVVFLHTTSGRLEKWCRNQQVRLAVASEPASLFANCATSSMAYAPARVVNGVSYQAQVILHSTPSPSPTSTGSTTSAAASSSSTFAVVLNAETLVVDATVPLDALLCHIGGVSSLGEGGRVFLSSNPAGLVSALVLRTSATIAASSSVAAATSSLSPLLTVDAAAASSTAAAGASNSRHKNSASAAHPSSSAFPSSSNSSGSTTTAAVTAAYAPAFVLAFSNFPTTLARPPMFLRNAAASSPSPTGSANPVAPAASSTHQKSDPSSSCLLLVKESSVHLGEPQPWLHFPNGGQCTIELWARYLGRVDDLSTSAKPLYAHGDRATTGEVYLEFALQDGAFCIKGGYRHDNRGTSVVAAYVPAGAQQQFLHIALSFKAAGGWQLVLNGRLMPNVSKPAAASATNTLSLERPRIKWTLGGGCIAHVAELRIWNKYRSHQELNRDLNRRLSGEEAGLVAYFPLSEGSGCALYNYARSIATTSSASIDSQPLLLPAAPAVRCKSVFREVVVDHPLATEESLLPTSSHANNIVGTASSSAFGQQRSGATTFMAHQQQPQQTLARRQFHYFHWESALTSMLDGTTPADVADTSLICTGSEVILMLGKRSSNGGGKHNNSNNGAKPHHHRLVLVFDAFSGHDLRTDTFVSSEWWVTGLHACFSSSSSLSVSSNSSANLQQTQQDDESTGHCSLLTFAGVTALASSPDIAGDDATSRPAAAGSAQFLELMLPRRFLLQPPAPSLSSLSSFVPPGARSTAAAAVVPLTAASLPTATSYVAEHFQQFSQGMGASAPVSVSSNNVGLWLINLLRIANWNQFQKSAATTTRSSSSSEDRTAGGGSIIHRDALPSGAPGQPPTPGQPSPLVQSAYAVLGGGGLNGRDDEADDASLFSPLRVDVSLETIEAATLVLREYFRPVHVAGGRRISSLNDSSPHAAQVVDVVLQVLQVQLHAILEAKLDPRPLSLAIDSSPDGPDGSARAAAAVLSEFGDDGGDDGSSPTFRHPRSPPPQANGEAAAAASTPIISKISSSMKLRTTVADSQFPSGGSLRSFSDVDGSPTTQMLMASSSTTSSGPSLGAQLVSTLCDLVNASGQGSLKPSTIVTATDMLRTGVVLFFPNDNTRVQLLAEMLSSNNNNNNNSAAPSSSSSRHKQPSIQVLLGGVLQHFATPSAAATIPLVVGEAAAAHRWNPTTTTPLVGSPSTTPPPQSGPTQNESKRHEHNTQHHSLPSIVASLLLDASSRSQQLLDLLATTHVNSNTNVNDEQQHHPLWSMHRVTVGTLGMAQLFLLCSLDLSTAAARGGARDGGGGGESLFTRGDAGGGGGGSVLGTPTPHMVTTMILAGTPPPAVPAGGGTASPAAASNAAVAGGGGGATPLNHWWVLSPPPPHTAGGAQDHHPVTSMLEALAHRDALMKDHFRVLIDETMKVLRTALQRMESLATQQQQHRAVGAVLDKVFMILSSSITGNVLFTALTAIPLVASLNTAPWLQEKLSQLAQQLRHMLRAVDVIRPSSSSSHHNIVRHLFDALRQQQSWLASFMVTTTIVTNAGGQQHGGGAYTENGNAQITTPFDTPTATPPSLGDESGGGAAAFLSLPPSLAPVAAVMTPPLVRYLVEHPLTSNGLTTLVDQTMRGLACTDLVAAPQVWMPLMKPLSPLDRAGSNAMQSAWLHLVGAAAHLSSETIVTTPYVSSGNNKGSSSHQAANAAVFANVAVRCRPLKQKLMEYQSRSSAVDCAKDCERVIELCQLLLHIRSSPSRALATNAALAWASQRHAAANGAAISSPRRGASSQHSQGPPSTHAAKWRRAIMLVRRALVLQRFAALSTSELSVAAAVEFLSRVCFSPVLPQLDTTKKNEGEAAAAAAAAAGLEGDVADVDASLVNNSMSTPEAMTVRRCFAASNHRVRVKLIGLGHLIDQQERQHPSQSIDNDDDKNNARTVLIGALRMFATMSSPLPSAGGPTPSLPSLFSAPPQRQYDADIRGCHEDLREDLLSRMHTLISLAMRVAAQPQPQSSNSFSPPRSGAASGPTTNSGGGSGNDEVAISAAASLARIVLSHRWSADDIVCFVASNLAPLLIRSCSIFPQSSHGVQQSSSPSQVSGNALLLLQSSDAATPRVETPAERAHRQAVKERLRLRNGGGGPSITAGGTTSTTTSVISVANDETPKLLAMATSEEATALSWLAVKELGLQLAEILRRHRIPPTKSTTTGMIAVTSSSAHALAAEQMLEQLFTGIIAELRRSLDYMSHFYYPAQERVSDHVTALCGIMGTFARALFYVHGSGSGSATWSIGRTLQSCIATASASLIVIAHVLSFAATTTPVVAEYALQTCALLLPAVRSAILVDDAIASLLKEAQSTSTASEALAHLQHTLANYHRQQQQQQKSNINNVNNSAASKHGNGSALHIITTIAISVRGNMDTVVQGLPQSPAANTASPSGNNNAATTPTNGCMVGASRLMASAIHVLRSLASSDNWADVFCNVCIPQTLRSLQSVLVPTSETQPTTDAMRREAALTVLMSTYGLCGIDGNVPQPGACVRYCIDPELRITEVGIIVGFSPVAPPISTAANAATSTPVPSSTVTLLPLCSADYTTAEVSISADCLRFSSGDHPSRFRVEDGAGQTPHEPSPFSTGEFPSVRVLLSLIIPALDAVMATSSTTTTAMAHVPLSAAISAWLRVLSTIAQYDVASCHRVIHTHQHLLNRIYTIFGKSSVTVPLPLLHLREVVPIAMAQFLRVTAVPMNQHSSANPPVVPGSGLHVRFAPVLASRYDLASVPDGLLDPTSQRLHVRSTAQAMVAAAVGGQFPPHLLSRSGSGGAALANELAILTSTLPGSMVGGYGSAGQSSSSTEASSYASFLRAMGPAPSSSTSSRYPQYGSTLLPTAASTTPNGISRAGLRVPMVVILLDKEAGLNVPVPSLEQPHRRQSAAAAAAASRRVVGDVASDDSSLDDDDIHARGDNNDHSNMFPLKPWPPVGGASPRAATTLASSSSSSPTGRSHPYHNVPSSAGITFGLAMYVHDTVSHAELGEPFSIPQQWEKHKCTSVFRRLIALVNGAGQPVLSIDFVNDRLVANIRTSTSSTTSDGEQATHVSLPLLPLSTADCVDRWTTLTFCLTHHEILGYRDGELVAALSLDEAEVPWLRSGEGDVVAVGSDDDDDGGSKIVSITVGQWAPLLGANNQQDTSIEECANHDKTPISVKNVRLWSTALPKHILRNSYDAAIALGLDSAHGYAKPVLSFLCNEGTGDCVKSDDGRWSMALIGEGAVWAPQLPFSSSTSTTMTLELDIEQSRAAQQPHTADGVHPLPGCDSSATLAANLSLPSADERDGHWASLPKQHDPDDVLLDFLVPRKELLAHYSALETSHLHVVTHTLMSSLIAHDARRCVLNTIATIMSARNDLYLATPHAIEQFQMLRLDSNNGGCGCGLEVGGGSDVNNAHTLNAIVQCENTVTMASNLVRYNNGPYIPRNQILTITRFCNAMLTTSLKQVQLLPDLQQDILRSFMSDALDTISSSSTSSSHGNSGLSSDQTEVFDVEIFYTALGANADCQLHPFSVMNGGNGWISFEVPRGMENLFLFADKQQKNSMAKFPDAQGSWPDTELSVAAAAAAAAAIAAATTSASSTSPFPSAWCYAKPNASMKASPARFRVRVPSHRPTVGHLCLQLLCEISLKQSTQQLTLTTTTTTSPTTPLPSAPLPPVLFDARVLSLFAALIRDHRGDRRIACLVTFTRILLLIREHAASKAKSSAPFPIHDRCPLHILLDRFNTFHFQTERRNASHPASVFMMSGAAVFPPVSRRVAELLATAVQVNAEWRGGVRGEQHQTARDVVHSTWNRLLTLQRVAAVANTPTSDATAPPPTVSQSGLAVGLSRVTLGASLAPSIQHASSSSVTWRKRSRGVWFVSCDRAWQAARSNVGLTRGRWYFEARLPPNGSHISVGLVSNAFQGVVEATSSTLGHCGSSWGFDGSRNSRWHNGIRNEFSSNPRIKWKGRDVIGLLMDLESGTLSCTHNGKPVSIGYDNVFVGSVNTCFYPAVSFTSSGCDVNFGGAPFVYDLPLGYLPVDVNLFMHPRAGILPLAAAIATIEIAEWSTKEKKMNPPLPFLLQSCDDAQSQHSSADVNLHQQQSRQGSAEVNFIQVSDRKKRCFDCEMRTGESAACLVRGTAVITLPSSSSSTMSPSSQGRWYFEIGIHGEGAVQLGWAAAPFNQRSIGEDALSWGIEGNRMLARHNRHNRSLGRHPWKDGDVIGCFLDLLPPTTTTSTTVTSPEDIVACIGYTINGQPLRDLHDSTSNGTMFQIKRHVLGASGGAGLSLVPVIQLEPSTILNVFTDACDLNFLPATFSPLGSGDYSRSALARWIQQPIRASATLPPTTTMSQLSSSQLEQFSQAISRMHDLSSYSHTTWSTRDVVSLHVASMQNAILNEAGTRASHNELETLIRWSLTIEGLLRDVGNLAAPWDNHLAGIPPSTNHTFTLPSAVTQLLQTVASPVVALDTLHLYMTSTNRSINEHVKLTLNRRKAHAIINPTVGGGDVTTADRLRGSLFGQLVSLVGKKPSTLFKTGKKLWSVSFAGEGADDVGGPYREALSEVSAELLNSSLALFVPSSNQTSGQGPYQDRFTVNPSLSSPLSLNLYTFLGRLMGGCLRSGEVLPLSLPPTFWIRLVNGSTNGLNSTTASLSFVDEHVAQSLLQIDGTYLDVDTPVVTDVTGKERLLYHSTSQASTIVTTHSTVSATASDAAALAYRALVAEFRVQVEGSDAWDAIAQGFYQVVPAFAIRSFKWHELEQSVCGQSDIDVEQLMSTVRLDGLKPTDRRIEFLKNILIQFTTHERALFLRFVTGRERQSFGLRLKLMPSTHHSSSSDELYDDAHLPHASTCFFWLSLPNYSSQEVMKSKLLFAINQCHDIDADFRVRNTDLEDDQGEDGQPTVAVREQDDEEEEFEDYHHLL